MSVEERRVTNGTDNFILRFGYDEIAEAPYKAMDVAWQRVAIVGYNYLDTEIREGYGSADTLKDVEFGWLLNFGNLAEDEHGYEQDNVLVLTEDVLVVTCQFYGQSGQVWFAEWGEKVFRAGEKLTKGDICATTSDRMIAVMSMTEARKEWGTLTPEEEVVEKATSNLKAEIKAFSLWASGLTLYWSLIREKVCSCCGTRSEEIVDSCGGYYEEFSEELVKQVMSDADVEGELVEVVS